MLDSCKMLRKMDSGKLTQCLFAVLQDCSMLHHMLAGHLHGYVFCCSARKILHVLVANLSQLAVMFSVGEEVRWTPWGIVSGIFWVPGAACGIYGIRNAGLAIAVGIWSSIIVITSFFWGIIVFEEKIRSLSGTCGAFALLIGGLIGMSRYSKPAPKQLLQQQSSFHAPDQESPDDGGSDSEEGGDSLLQAASKRKTLKPMGSKIKETAVSSLEIEPLVIESVDNMDTAESAGNAKGTASKERIVFCRGRVALTRRQLGIVGAVINGVWGGTNLIPLHYASKQGFGGAGYIISYATGSFLVNICVWLLILAYYTYEKSGSIREAIDCLPSWHLQELWYPGLLAGCLYSMGNFAGILAVTYLGQGVGYSFCQSSILVSGLWGIFFFKEIRGRETIAKWFASAFITIAGILWLSYEHQGESAH